MKEENTGVQENVAEEVQESSSADLSAPISIKNVTATSVLSESTVTHSPERVIDKDSSTAWVEGVDGNGIGESITLYFEGTHIIHGIDIQAGYQKNADTYTKNARPAQLRLSFSNGTSQTYTLQDVNEVQSILLNQPVSTEYVTFTIEAAYTGTKYEDTVISEISVY